MFRADALSVCRALLPTWSGVLDARLEPITGGITNTLRKVVPSVFFEKENENGTNEPSPSEPEPGPVVLRVFGRGTEAFLDRDTENAALAELNACGFGARCLGVFKNGRLEAFLADARPAAPAEMADASVSRAVAAALRRFHACDARARLGDPLPANISPKRSQTWDIMRSWHAAATSGAAATRDPRLAALGLDGMARDVDALQAATARAADAPTVLLHNDALAGNVMLPAGYRPGSRELGHEPPTVTLIDFEYSCYGPRGFDLANHLIEHAGFECDWRALPSRAFRRDFCAAYLGDEAADEAAVTKLRLETEAFYPVSHLWWGLWAAMQARTSTIDFDYAGYAAKRLAEFRRLLNDGRRESDGRRRPPATTDDDDADVFGPH